MKPKAAAIIPAAGSGTRMQSDRPKQYLELCGKPILIHTISAFSHNEHIDEIVVAVPADHITETKELISTHNLSQKVRVIPGGVRRQDSVEKGLKAISHSTEIVLVHDGARPLLSDTLITDCYNGAVAHGSAIAAVPVKDTLKKELDGKISKTIDRSKLWHAQTPQAARTELLKRGYELLLGRDVTDEASILEAANIPVTLIMGSETNLKITRPEDLQLAERIIMQSTPAFRIGHGYDAHKFEAGRKLVLCGVTIDHPLGLAGHSDADVATHALCDAILGALGKGDIGKHFPDTSSEFKDIYSILLLERVIADMDDDGYQVNNLDMTIICQSPKLAPHIPFMKKIISDACRLQQNFVNIKATTTERMGFCGREEGIGCHCVVSLSKKS